MQGTRLELRELHLIIGADVQRVRRGCRSQSHTALSVSGTYVLLLGYRIKKRLMGFMVPRLSMAKVPEVADAAKPAV